MTAAPGKACGPCTMCCSALEIAELKKPAGPLCVNCRLAGGCAIYADRPQVCRDFECEWLTRRDLARRFRPDLVGVILMEDADSDEYRAVCPPEKPMAWRQPQIFAHLVADRQVRPSGGRQGRSHVLADLRLRSMECDGLGGAFCVIVHNFCAEMGLPDAT